MRWWSSFGFVFRYISTLVSVVMTLLTIRAQDAGDTVMFYKLILWGLIPTGVRTLASMWTSTLDRQLAKDRMVESNAFVSVINLLRRSTGRNYASLGRFGKMARTAGAVLRGGDPHAGAEHPIDTRATLLKRYVFLAKFIEIPINYVIQKFFVIILVYAYFYPNSNIPYLHEIEKVSRWIRVVTVILLAPLNHYLGYLRVWAFDEIEREYVDIVRGLLAELRQTCEESARRFSNDDRNGEWVLQLRETVPRLRGGVWVDMELETVVRRHIEQMNMQNSTIVLGHLSHHRSDAFLADAWKVHQKCKATTRALEHLRKLFSEPYHQSTCRAQMVSHLERLDGLLREHGGEEAYDDYPRAAAAELAAEPRGSFNQGGTATTVNNTDSHNFL